MRGKLPSPVSHKSDAPRGSNAPAPSARNVQDTPLPAPAPPRRSDSSATKPLELWRPDSDARILKRGQFLEPSTISEIVVPEKAAREAMRPVEGRLRVAPVARRASICNACNR